MINTRKDKDYWEPSRTGFVTNYPNFLHWKRLASEKMSNTRPLNVYVHIPFCIQRCAYCYYKTINLRGRDKSKRMDEYVDALCREIELASDYYGLQERPVNSVYFGGGTPSLLSAEQLQRVIQTVRKNLKADSCQFTVESEPVTLTQPKADMLREMDIQRISMGVQSFDDDIIKRSNRLDDEKQVMKAVEIARSTGAQVNIDIMSGLAGETTATWRHSVERAIASESQSITVYKTELYSNTPYYKELREERLNLPDDVAELDFMEYAMDELVDAGYHPWSFFTFTKGDNYRNEYAKRTFMGEDLYSFGVSAFGRLGNTLFQNTNDEQKYVALIEEDELPVARGYELTSLDSMIRDVVMGMKMLKFDLRDFQERHGFRLETLCSDTLSDLQSDGYISLSEDEISLTKKGLLHGDYSGKSLVKNLMEWY